MKEIKNYTRYIVTRDGEVKNKYTKKIISTRKGQVCLTSDTGVRSRRSVKVLMKEAGYLK